MASTTSSAPAANVLLHASRLEVDLFAFSGICCVIAISNIVLGLAAIPGSISGDETLDSEERRSLLRNAVPLTWAAIDFPKREGMFAALLLVFFTAGLARVISMLDVDPTLYSSFSQAWNSSCLIAVTWHRAT